MCEMESLPALVSYFRWRVPLYALEAMKVFPRRESLMQFYVSVSVIC